MSKLRLQTLGSMRGFELATLAISILLAGCSESTAPAKPGSIEFVAGTSQIAVAGQALANAPTFVVKDQKGNSMVGVPVTVAVTSGGGSISGAPSKTLAGATPIGTWTLGPKVGTNRLSVTAPGLSPVSVTIESAPGAAAKFIAGATSFDGMVGSLVGPGPSATLVDVNDNTVPGAPVSVLLAGGGQGPSNLVTDGLGNISITNWTLGTAKGINTLTLNSGAASITFAAGARPGPATSILALSGSNQSAKAGTPIPTPIGLAIVDRYNNGIESQVAAFTVSSGGGSLSSSSAVSDANGIFQVPTWILGKSAIPQSVLVSAGSLSRVVTASVQTSYNIQVRFFGPAMSADQRALFENAAARISGIITGDVVDINAVNYDVGLSCGVTGVAPLNEVIDDVVIYASISSIDGPGNVLASARSCANRSSAYRGLTAIGVMNFDVADMALMTGDGSLQDVITHEMLHVIGIGSYLWSMNGYLTNYGTPQVGYLGSQARQGCLDSGGFVTCSSMVPVENTGPVGTAGAHWRESVFGSEMMTGYSGPGSAPISLITVGGLFDIGYTVNPSAADLFRPGTFSTRSDDIPSPRNREGWEDLTPRNPQIIYPDGRVEPVPKQ